MKKISVLIVLFVLLLSKNLKAQDTTVNVPIVGFDHVEELLKTKNNDTVYVVNFWATWCKPCIKELPFFTGLEEKYADKKIKVYLVSLDFTKKHDRVVSYLKERSIKTSSVLLSAPDANAWIDKVDKSWSGAIPATVIFNNNKREFYEKQFHEKDLYETVETFF